MSSPPRDNPPTGLTVDSIVEAPIVETQDAATSVSLEELTLENQWLINAELRANIQRRQTWANRIFWLIVGWLVSVIAAVVCQGFGLREFHLDDSVIIAFISTTTVNVLTLGYIVANYLFPKPK